MGRYKEENGISRIQALLEKASRLKISLPPEVTRLVGVVSPRIGQLLNAFNALTKDGDTDASLKEDLLEALDFAIEEMEHTSARHQVDSNGDNWASKNIRPWTLFFLLKFCAFLTLAHIFSWGIALPSEIVDKWIFATEGALFFYFGGRELTKMVRSASGSEEKKSKLKFWKK